MFTNKLDKRVQKLERELGQSKEEKGYKLIKQKNGKSN
jgi:hypothetical protein